MIGHLARKYGQRERPLEVLQSAAGYYLGTQDGGMPFTRESAEYFPTATKAREALTTGTWTQRQDL